MTRVSIACLFAGFSVVALANPAVLARGQESKTAISDQIEQSEKAARVFNEIMNTPDKAMPESILDKAECVAVFPSVLRAGFVVGGRGGRGVVSCRTAAGWSGPAYFNLGGGSFGWQFGAESTDLVMLFMTNDGVNSLLSSKFTLGAGVSAAAGPVGRQAGVATDAKLNAQILSYSRSKGLFAGAVLDGTVIDIDKDDMRDVYGAGVVAREVLKEGKLTAPPAIRAYPNMLARYSSRKATM